MGNSRRIVLSVFDHFWGLALKVFKLFQVILHFIPLKYLLVKTVEG